MKDLDDLKKNIPQIEKALDYTFLDNKHLILALTHSSYINENKDLIDQSNERLEFLGDSLLNFFVASHLYLKYPDSSEGALSHLKSKLVDAESCVKYLLTLKVDDYLLMGKGEKKNFIEQKNLSIQADLFEAILAAIYLDGGLSKSKDFFFAKCGEVLQELCDKPIRNWKAELQDYTQKKYQKIPVYKVIEEVGPDHDKTFQITVLIDDMILGSGYGSSKKHAQQSAASDALCRLSFSKSSES